MHTPLARLALLAAAAAAGCAPQTSGARTDVGTVVSATGGVLNTTAARDARVDTLSAAPTPALEATSAAYWALGLTPNVLDQGRRVVGVQAVQLIRSLQGVPLTQYVDCGMDVGVPVAGNNRVELTMLSELRPAGAGTVLLTTLTARVRKVSSGAAADVQACTSLGLLEKKLAQAARDRVPKSE